MMNDFQKELEELINKYSIENECDMPDFMLADTVCLFISTCRLYKKTNLDWHGCDSVCHPKSEET